MVTVEKYYILKAIFNDSNFKYLCVNPSFLGVKAPIGFGTAKQFTLTDDIDHAENFDEIPNDLQKIKENCDINEDISLIIPIEVTVKTQTEITYKYM